MNHQSARNVPMTLSPEVREILGRTTAVEYNTLLSPVRFLAALSAKADRTGSPMFAGISTAERDRRRAKGRVAKATRKRNRVS